MYYAGYFTQPLVIDDDGKGDRKDGGFVGYPLDPERNPVIAGNRSGHAMTSIVAKMMKVFDTLTVFDDLYHDVLERYHTYMTWKAPLSVFNNGDDEGVTGSPQAVERYRKYRYARGVGYFSVSEEIGQVFSGSMFMKVDGVWKAVGRAQVPFEKIYCPERGIGGVFRKFWPIGIVTRLENLKLIPSGSLLEEIFRRRWHDDMSADFGSFGDLLAKALESMPFQIDALTAIDREVLDDPEKMHYKYDEKDISPHILENLTGKVTYDEYKSALRYYGGNVHEAY